MNILSLFGGIECGRVAIERLGIPVDKYFSSEIDPYAIKIAKANYPDIVHIGDIRGVTYYNDEILMWDKEGDNSRDQDYLGTIDLLIGGSPCQDLSIAKKNGKGLEGEKSSLFYEYVRILKEMKPKYFLLENVASMKKADRDEITRIIGVEPIMINSSLVSAQNRKRLYWFGKLNEQGEYETIHISQPQDKGILLRDILEDIPMDDKRWKPLDKKYLTDSFFEKIAKGTISLANIHPTRKAYPVTATYAGACPRDYLEKHQRELVIGQFRRGTNLRIHADQDNSPTLTSNMGTGGNNVPVILGLAHRNRGEGKQPECNGMEKANSITTVQSDSEILGIFQKPRGKNSGGIAYDGEKSPTITGSFEDNSKLLAEHELEYYWRKLTPIEAERLQTLHDGYTAHVSDSRRYKAIGNGWTVDVIAHILSFIPLS